VARRSRKRFTEKLSSTHRRPARPISAARCGSDSSSAAAAAMASGSRGSARRPVSPGRIASGAPPSVLAMTGRPVPPRQDDALSSSSRPSTVHVSPAGARIKSYT
jgi:hypothetical protein